MEQKKDNRLGFWLWVRNFLSPPHCIFCGKGLHFHSRQLVCAHCAATLPYVTGRVCRVCSTPLHTVYGELLCLTCRKEKRYIVKNIARYQYKDHVRRAILHMKFGKEQVWISRALGEFLLQSVEQQYAGITFDVIVPVPLSKQRLKQRGFNQVSEMARPVSKRLCVPLLEDCLVKIRETEIQSRLSLDKRKENVKHAYQVKRPQCIAGKTVLLLDDVYTTGATINECARTLLQAGALMVYAATATITSKETIDSTSYA